MFERFTDRARRAVVAAQEAARSLNHSYIGTEHLLLGLMDPHTGGVAADVLGQLGLDHETARAWIREQIGAGQRPLAATLNIPFTPRAKKVLELSLRESLKLGHNYIGTEHILLALLDEREGVAARFIVTHATSPTLEPEAAPDTVVGEARRRVIETLTGWSQEDAPAGSAGRGGWVGHAGPSVTIGTTARGQARSSDLGPTTPAVTSVLRTATDYARGAPLATHHLLAAMLDASLSLGARLLSEGGFDVAALSRPVLEHSTVGTSDETADERGARGLELRVEGGRLVVEVDDDALAEQVRLLARSLGAEGGAEAPVRIGPTYATMPAFIDIGKALRRSLTRAVEDVPREDDQTAGEVDEPDQTAGEVEEPDQTDPPDDQ
ncbi:MAG TPA: Clp protease N-terminal domain-containing protein [Nitriliruptorales bacterium]